MKHVHAEVIKAWADGAQIQYKYRGNWIDIAHGGSSPCWTTTSEYRVKPEPSLTIPYRRYIWKLEDNYRVALCTNIALINPTQKDKSFIRWIDDTWVTHEV